MSVLIAKGDVRKLKAFQVMAMEKFIVLLVFAELVHRFVIVLGRNSGVMVSSYSG